jgi:DNA-binding NarL/FixJ family response regulator
VAHLLAQGLPTKAIAAALGVSIHTVRRHSESVFKKLNVNTRTAAALVIRDYSMEERTRVA